MVQSADILLSTLHRQLGYARVVNQVILRPMQVPQHSRQEPLNDLKMVLQEALQTLSPKVN